MLQTLIGCGLGIALMLLGIGLNTPKRSQKRLPKRYYKALQDNLINHAEELCRK